MFSKLMRRGNDKEDQTLSLYGIEINIQEAPEVTNVVWENLSVHYHEVVRNQFITVFVICAILFLVLVFFIFSKSAATSVLFKFPPSTNCDTINSMFNSVNETT